MKIILSDNLMRLLNDNNLKSLVKILEVRSNSTLIQIKGHQFDVPFVLNKDSRYTSTIKKGVLNIIENKIKNEVVNEIKSDNIHKLLSELIDPAENDNISIFSFLRNMLLNNNENVSERKNKKKNYVFRDKKNAVIFILDINLYDKPAKLFLHILRQNLNIILYCIMETELKKTFENKIKSHIINNYNNINAEIRIFNNKEKFYDNIELYLSDVDIKV
jgi:hypothetical protein